MGRTRLLDQVTVLLPYRRGCNQEWLTDALQSIPPGVKYLRLENDGELADALNTGLNMTPPHNNFGDSRPHQPESLHDSDGRPYGIADMFRDIKDMKKRVDKACDFIDGEKGDGSDSAKVRIDRLEQSEKAREAAIRSRDARINVALGASLVTLFGVIIAWVRSVSQGGTH